MNSEAVPPALAPAGPRRIHSPRWPREVASVVSTLLHVAVLLVLLTTFHDREGAKPPARPRSISLTIAPPVLAPTPPKPVVAPPQEERPPAPVPTPAPAPSLKPRPARAKPATKPVPASPTPSKTTKQDTETEELDNIIGRIHDNWLEPPGYVPNFRCRLHIDYDVDGMITAVKFLKACGSDVLDDSVRRAIWKTQPLPLIRTKREAGSIEIDFTP